MYKALLYIVIICLFSVACHAQKPLEEGTVTYAYIGEGWANNSINTVIFRRNALVSQDGFQFAAYYDGDGYMVLARRELSSDKWERSRTEHKGNVKDAHNTISIALDGDGYLHVAWDHHDNPLRYAKSKTPFSLELDAKSEMTGKEEQKVTYPEFHQLANGNLLFLFRSGASGTGNLVINQYDLESKKWQQMHNNLIDGEGERNAYWQAYVDQAGTIHLSWVWRESWDVATNHDMAYARSKDGGKTWESIEGKQYQLPVTMESATYAWKIPQQHSLINQTAMATDKSGNPYIVSYWAENDTPQYHVIYHKEGKWQKSSINHRKTTFTLGGGGTKSIPISRPQILVDDAPNGNVMLYVLYRDEASKNNISMAYQALDEEKWYQKTLSDADYGQWEPTYDISLWKEKRILHLFLQAVHQIDGEGLAEGKTSPVRVLQLEQ